MKESYHILLFLGFIALVCVIAKLLSAFIFGYPPIVIAGVLLFLTLCFRIVRHEFKE